MSTFRVVNKDFFKEWSEEMAYILGYWFADGCIWSGGGHYNFSITSNDYNHLKLIRDTIKSNHKLYKRKTDKSYKLDIRCKEIYNDIIKLGGTERKSLTAKFPNVPKEYVRHFIRGYFDGDGSFTLRNNEPYITFIGTYEFLTNLVNQLLYNGVIKKVTNNNTYRVYYNAEFAREILKYMYDNSNILLNRKFKLYEKSMSWNRRRKLRIDSRLLELNGYPRSYSYGV